MKTCPKCGGYNLKSEFGKNGEIIVSKCPRCDENGKVLEED